MIEWKWTKGEPYERSRRPQKKDNNTNNINNTNTISNTIVSDEKFTEELEKTAYSSSLNYDEDTWDVLNQSIYNGFRISNKREDLDMKIADRQLIQQIGSNPFLSNTNYIDDMNIRDKFLKPMNTTMDREKPNHAC
jgi:hypothetical protein